MACAVLPSNGPVRSVGFVDLTVPDAPLEVDGDDSMRLEQ